MQAWWNVAEIPADNIKLTVTYGVVLFNPWSARNWLVTLEEAPSLPPPLWRVLVTDIPLMAAFGMLVGQAVEIITSRIA